MLLEIWSTFLVRPSWKHALTLHSHPAALAVQAGLAGGRDEKTKVVVSSGFERSGREERVEELD